MPEPVASAQAPAAAASVGLGATSPAVDVAVNTGLHIFLLSLFVVCFYYIRVAPTERSGFLSKTASIPGDVESAVFWMLAKDDEARSAVCNLTPAGWAKDFAQQIQHALAAQADAQREARLAHNAKLRNVAILVVVLALLCTGLLYALNADKLVASDIVFWNVLTFVIFTAFELVLFYVVIMKYIPITDAQETHALVQGSGLQCTARPSAG